VLASLSQGFGKVWQLIEAILNKCLAQFTIRVIQQGQALTVDFLAQAGNAIDDFHQFIARWMRGALLLHHLLNVA
jgi:hypothetical protein